MLHVNARARGLQLTNDEASIAGVSSSRRPHGCDTIGFELKRQGTGIATETEYVVGSFGLPEKPDYLWKIRTVANVPT